MDMMNNTSRILRKPITVVANRTTRVAKRKRYQARISSICQKSVRLAPDLAVGFNAHIFDGLDISRSPFAEDYVASADEIAQGSFVLFGRWLNLSELRCSGSSEWRTDFLTGVEFPERIYTEVKPKDNCADIKVPWEYGRMHYLLPLAAAYCITKKGVYLDAFRAKVESFWKYNPLGTGVQWTCTMEVGIRIFNVLLAYELISDNLPVSDALHVQVAEMAYCHGEHIWANLETSARLQENNHYIADLLGLAAIISYYPAAPNSSTRGRYVKKELIRCARKQVLDDGCCFERSTRYTRLVGEMLFFAGKLLKGTEHELPSEYHSRLSRLGEFLSAITDDKGDALQLGDNDSGRALCISPDGYDDLRLMGRLLSREQFCAIGSASFLEEDLFYGSAGKQPLEPAWDDGVKEFADAGFALIRKGGFSLGVYATDGFKRGGEAGHSHNDKLSFTLDVDGEHFFVDPGSGLYTSNTEVRDKLRSTAQHSTLWFEGLEQNKFKNLFGYTRCGGASLKIRADVDDCIAIDCKTDCWKARVGVIHARKMFLGAQGLLIRDELSGLEPKAPAFRSFVLSPDVEVESIFENQAVLKSRGVHLLLEANSFVTRRSGLYSKRFGEVEETAILDVPFAPGADNIVSIKKVSSE